MLPRLVLARTGRSATVAKAAIRPMLLVRSSRMAAALTRPISTTPLRQSTGKEPPAPTATRDPSFVRDPRYATVTVDDIAVFRSIVRSPTGVLSTVPGDPHAVTDDDVLPYNMDWMRKYRGQSRVVVRPSTTAQVSAILAHCHARRLAVVPQGGNTGLVGGSVPVFDEIIVHLGHMNTVRAFDPVSGVVTADAGVVLETLDNYLRDRGHMMPLDLGAKGSCTIGGNVATNAGGLRLVRYGSLRGTVLGVEAVLPDGRVLDALTSLRKDNTGLDLKQLLIGSEGALGIITAVSVLAPMRPLGTHVATLAVESYEGVVEAFTRAKREVGETLSAFEFWDAAASSLVTTHLPWLRNPLSADADAGTPYPFQVLIETAGANPEHNEAKLEAYLERLLEDGIAVDGAVAQDGAQATAMWNIRESIPEACARDGAVYKYDVSVPVPALYSLVEASRDRLKGVDGVKGVIGYGHVGDGNLHLNIAAHEYSKTVVGAIEPWVYEWVSGHRGSISAEHGVG
ncbi:Aip2 protein, partial [Blastocladiella britannica]